MVYLRLTYEFIRFALKCSTLSQIKSLKLKLLLAEILDDKKNYYIFNKIEKIRQHYLQSNESIEILDFGVGSRVQSIKTRKLSSIIKSSSSSPWQCRVLFRLTHRSKAKTILELGTSLGISLAYLCSANTKAQVLSIEGDPELVRLSKKNIEALLIYNASVIEGRFDECLSQSLDQLSSIDLAFIDGNHQLEPTLDYFHQILPYCHKESILIFDDIHWSKNMKKAWKKIIEHPKVSASVNFFHFGLVFFDPGISGHYKILPKIF